MGGAPGVVDQGGVRRETEDFHGAFGIDLGELAEDAVLDEEGLFGREFQVPQGDGGGGELVGAGLDDGGVAGPGGFALGGVEEVFVGFEGVIPVAGAAAATAPASVDGDLRFLDETEIEEHGELFPDDGIWREIGEVEEVRIGVFLVSIGADLDPEAVFGALGCPFPEKGVVGGEVLGGGLAVRVFQGAVSGVVFEDGGDEVVLRAEG